MEQIYPYYIFLGIGIIAVGIAVIIPLKRLFTQKKPSECEYANPANFGVGGTDFAYHIAEITQGAK